MQIANFAYNLNRILKVNVYICDFSVVYLNHDYNIAKAVIYVNPFLWVYMTFKFYYITDMHHLIVCLQLFLKEFPVFVSVYRGCPHGCIY